MVDKDLTSDELLRKKCRETQSECLGRPGQCRPRVRAMSVEAYQRHVRREVVGRQTGKFVVNDGGKMLIASPSPSFHR
jgi:hypothetical protein